MLPKIAACFCLICAVGWGSASAGQNVALRASDGRFLRPAENGALRPGRLLPAEEETFELLPCENGRLVLKALDSRPSVPGDNIPRSSQADSPPEEPGEQQTFVLAPLGDGQAPTEAAGPGRFIVVAQGSMEPAVRGQPDKPRDDQIVEVYRVAEVPPAIRSLLGLAIRGLAVDKLGREEYRKVRTRERKEFVELPAPTLRNLRRKKRHRLLSTREEYQLTARLDGPPEIRIARMLCLKGYDQQQTGLMMFDIRASVPVSGRVRYKVPNALSASTGFRTLVRLTAVGQVHFGKPEGDLSLNPPEVLQLRVQVHRLDLSNDVLHVVRRGIEDLVNDELRENKDRICQAANKAIRKAIEGDRVRHPVFRYLTFL